MDGYATGYVTAFGPPAGGEEAGAKAEKPDQAWSRFGSCLSMEPEQKRRLGDCPKSDFEYDHHGCTTHPARL
jgi:hypothetical protein